MSCPRVLPNGQHAKFLLARWAGAAQTPPLEVSSDAPDECHVLTVFRRKTRGEFSLGHRVVAQGRVRPEQLFLTGPRADSCRLLLFEGSDQIGAYIPQSLIAECYEAAFGRPPSADICLFETDDGEDKALQFLTRVLRDLGSFQVMGPDFLEGLGLAIASRLVELHCRQRVECDRKSSGQLQRRLARVVDYIDARLSRPIYLNELSEVAGFGRMHFSAQFYAATGYPP